MNSSAQGTIEEPFLLKQKSLRAKLSSFAGPAKSTRFCSVGKESIAQGTIEYLVTIAVIVVISLIVVGLVMSTTDSSSNVASASSKISQSSSLISVFDAVVGADGNGLVSFSNNSGGLLIITKLSVDGVDSNYSDVSMSQGDEKTFSLNGVGSGCSCVGFEGKTKTCEVIIYAESEYGLEKQFPVAVSVDCVPVASATNLSAVVQPSNEPQEDILPEISFIDPTPADNASTENSFVDINVSITSAPDLNEFKWNWNDTNYSLYDDSLVLMMNLDNVSALGEDSVNVTDVSEYGNNGTNTGSILNSNGRYGSALEFDGSDDYTTIPDADSLDISDLDLTVSAWVSIAPACGDGRPYCPIASKWGDADLGEKRTWFLQAQGLSIGLAASEDGTESGIFSGDWASASAYDKWTYVVSTIDSTSISIYIDGVLATTKNHTKSAIYTNDLPLYIGSGTMSHNLYPMYYFPGLIDEVRIYNRALSADDINQLYYSNLRKYDVNKWIFDSNQQNLSGGTYNYQAFADDANVGSNQTEERSVTILDVCPATGGTETIVGNYCIHTFLSSGTFNIPSGNLSADVLVVAGGGGGGESTVPGGGGGAGGYVYVESTSVVAGSHTVIVGAGGAGGSGSGSCGIGSGWEGLSGSNSSLGDIVAVGGGGGAAYCPSENNNGGNGGSGGGGSFPIGGLGGLGTINQGNNGGDGGDGGDEGGRGGGGGGGAGTIGVTGTVTSGGNGGNGLTNSISGTTVTYAGGGGGGVWDCWGHPEYPAGTGGSGGGGDGTCNQNGEDGIPNSGGGGGGTGWYYGSESNGGAGGSGIVIVRYSKVS